MRVVRSLNNNVVLAVDDSGKEVVLFGKGLGFHPMPYELGDESRVQRGFYEVNPSLLKMVETLSDDVLLASSEIVDLARDRLGCALNPNLPFTLGDHIQFAIQYAKDGIVIENPLEAEIELVYPSETEIGLTGLEIVRLRCGVELPRNEAFAMAVHIVNGEAPSSQGSSMDLVMKSTSIIDGIVNITERSLGTTIDRTSYRYMRFVTHLRFLIGRLMKPGAMEQDENASMGEVLPTLAERYPTAAECARQIGDYLASSCGWACTDEELLYLLLHVNQFITGQ